VDNTFHVDIVSPEKIIYSQEALSLVVPAELGYMGILANHAPLVARLVKGKITLKDNSKETKFFDVPGSGFIEVLKNKVTLILGGLERMGG
jgi:F-type H+-transporting ATPase subunit epsilon